MDILSQVFMKTYNEPEKLSNMHLFNPYSKVPAFLHVTDIAGLVKGAHEGQGLGNAFLSHVSACDALFHLSSKLRAVSYFLGMAF